MVRVAGPGPEESDLGCDIERYRGMVLYRLWVGPAQVDGFWMLYSRLMKTGGRLVARGSILSAHSPAVVGRQEGSAGTNLVMVSQWLCCPPSTGLWRHRNVPARPDPIGGVVGC